MAQGQMSSILVTIRITVRIQESEVRNPDSPDYRKSYQRILMTFYGELGCSLGTNWLHFGEDPRHYSDPGVRSGSRFGSGKNCQHTEQMPCKNHSAMLSFGGGLCSLSTSTFGMKYDFRQNSRWRPDGVLHSLVLSSLLMFFSLFICFFFI